jgi:peptidyl-prolyl cis-trans isomerase D
MIRFLQSGSKAVKFMIGAFLLIICAAMVITLVPGGMLGDAFGVGQAGVIAKVAGEDITANDATTMAQNMAQRQMQGRSVPSQLMPFFTSQAVQTLISQKALVAEANRMGLKVTNDELLKAIRQIPAFYPNGQFIGQQAYERLLQENNMSVDQFEQSMKQDLLIRKLQDVVTGSVSVSDDAVQQEFKNRNTKVKFDYAVLSPADMDKLIHPTDADLRAFFDKNKERYKMLNPEKRKAQYIMVDASKLKGAQVTDDDLKHYYTQHIDEYRVPDEVFLRHIAFKTPLPDASGKRDEKAVAEARAKAENVLKQVKSGADFATLAKKYSEDEGTKESGGSLGWITHGRFPELDNVLFSLQKGQTTDVVQSSYGFHIFKAEDKQSAHVKSLDEVKNDIRPIVQQQKEDQAAEREANSLLSSARAMGMQKAADKNGQPLQTTELVPRTAQLPPSMAEAMFSAQEKDPPQMLKVPQGYVIYQVTQIQPPVPPTFEEARATVEADYKRERASSLLQEKVQQLAEKAKSEHNLKAAAKEFGAEVKTSELVTPDSQVPDLGSLRGPAQVVFSMKPGEISNPIQTGRGAAVIALVDKQEPPASDFAAQKDKLRDELLDQKRNDAMNLFVSNLRAQMEKDGKIKIYKKELDRLTPGGRNSPFTPGE